MSILGRILGRSVTKTESEQVAELNEIIANKDDELGLLETELEATKRALETEETEADRYARELDQAQEAIAMLYELAKDKLEPADDVRYDAIAAALAKKVSKNPLAAIFNALNIKNDQPNA